MVEDNLENRAQELLKSVLRKGDKKTVLEKAGVSKEELDGLYESGRNWRKEYERKKRVFGNLEITKKLRDAFYSTGQHFEEPYLLTSDLPSGFDSDDNKEYIVHLDPENRRYR